jgi:hypothetical protein
MHMARYLDLLHRSEFAAATALRTTATAHADEPDLAHTGLLLADQCEQHSQLLTGPREGGIGLLRDLHDLYLLAAECDVCWTIIGQAAQGARDPDLLSIVHGCAEQTTTQLAWLRTRMKHTAPQALIVAP